MKLFKKIIFWVLGGLLLGILVCFWTNFEIESKTQDFVTDDIEKLPNQKVGLPLLSKGGIINLIAKSLIFRGFIKGLLFLFFCVLVSMLVTQ